MKRAHRTIKASREADAGHHPIPRRSLQRVPAGITRKPVLVDTQKLSQDIAQATGPAGFKADVAVGQGSQGHDQQVDRLGESVSVLFQKHLVASGVLPDRLVKKKKAPAMKHGRVSYHAAPKLPPGQNFWRIARAFKICYGAYLRY
jgi:hypothetical protein